MDRISALQREVDSMKQQLQELRQLRTIENLEDFDDFAEAVSVRLRKDRKSIWTDYAQSVSFAEYAE